MFSLSSIFQEWHYTQHSVSCSYISSCALLSADRTRDVMRRNIDAALVRGDTLCNLKNKSDDLSYQSKSFHKTAQKSNTSWIPLVGTKLSNAANWVSSKFKRKNLIKVVCVSSPSTLLTISLLVSCFNISLKIFCVATLPMGFKARGDSLKIDYLCLLVSVLVNISSFQIQ